MATTGIEIQGRCTALCSILEVSGIELGKYVRALSRKVPSQNWTWDSEDLEQYIYSQLMLAKSRIVGNWDRIKLVASGAYKNWWTRYVQDRNMGELQAISLQRQDVLEDIESGDIEIPDSIDLEGEITGKLAVKALLESLPAPIRNIIIDRLLDVPTTPIERQRLHRFLSTGDNDKNVVRVLLGATETPTQWVTPKRVGRPKKSVTTS